MAQLGPNFLEPGEVSANPKPQKSWRHQIADELGRQRQRISDAFFNPLTREAQPGERGVLFPGKVGEDGKVQAAVPGMIAEPVESWNRMVDAPIADIMRSQDRNAIEQLAIDSFNVAGALPMAGVAVSKTMGTPKPRVADMGEAHTVPDAVYTRKPKQADWLLGHAPSARDRLNQAYAIGEEYGRGPESMASGVRVIGPDTPQPAFRNIGQDPVPGLRRMDGSAVYSNPDDVTTAGIINMMDQGQPQGLNGKQTAPDRSLGPSVAASRLPPKAGAIGAPSNDRVGSQVLAETAESIAPVRNASQAASDYENFVRSLRDDPQSEPTIGMATPGVDPAAVRAAYEDGLRRWHREFGPHVTEKTDPFGALDGPLGSDLGAVMDALRSAAKVAGRDLDVAPRSLGSQYGRLSTPSGDKWSVRVADHGNQSRHYSESDFNIAPGQMSVDEFLDLLPKVYSNPDDVTTAAILDLMAAEAERQSDNPKAAIARALAGR